MTKVKYKYTTVGSDSYLLYILSSVLLLDLLLCPTPYDPIVYLYNMLTNNLNTLLQQCN